MSVINTSYDQQYVIVSKDANSVTLRPIGGGLLQTYWQQFLAARVVTATAPTGPVVIRLRKAPPEVLRVDAYSALRIEYPQVVASCNGIEADVSNLVTANKPNTEVPGLYVISYRLALPGDPDNEIWRSYVSVEEPPVLRQVITPWNRSSYTIATLNRLLLEPQFQEALYEEGAPLYNFVTSNTSPALRRGDLSKLKNAACAKSGRNLFIAGPKVPSSSRLWLAPAHGAEYEVHIDRTIGTQGWGPGEYLSGAVVMKESLTYLALSSTTAGDIPGSSQKWVAGHLYRLEEELEGVSPDAQAWEREPDGVLLPRALWVWVDLRGYIFDVDALHAPALGTYWGYYDAKNFYDYAPGDLVSYISDGVLYIYRRNGTDIQDVGTEEAYRPGDFHNPHWEEAYAAYTGGSIRDFGRYLAPVTNAANGVVVKTGSLSELSCSLYAYMMGIPDSIVDQIGSKCSVFLYILLQRTRDTFEGFRNAFRAIGMDVSDLHRVYSTVETVDGEGLEYDSVYAEAAALKAVAQSIQAGKLYQDGMDPSVVQDPEGPDDLPWVRYYPDPATALATKHHGPYAIQEYRGGAWSTIYEIEGFGDSYPQGADKLRGNNRYYKCTVSLLSRLAKNAIADLHDGKQWIDLNAYSKDLSSAVTDVCTYEVPMYIYLRARILLASICYAARQGVSSVRFHRDTYGGTPTLYVYPFKYFDFATGLVKAVYPRVKIYGSDITDVTIAEPDKQCGEAQVYFFDHTPLLQLDMADSGMDRTAKYWTSRHTLGYLGVLNTTSPIDAADRFLSDIVSLSQGIVGATAIPTLGRFVATVEYYAWNYIFSDDGSTTGDEWVLDNWTPFAELKAGECEVFSTQGAATSSAVLADEAAYVLDENGEDLPCSWAKVPTSVPGTLNARLYIKRARPKMVYIYGSEGGLLAYVKIPEQELEGPIELGRDSSTAVSLTFSPA